jgi:hypothetical protein
MGRGARHSNYCLVANHIANDGECLLPNLIRGRDEIRIVELPIIGLKSQDESIDCDGVRAFDHDRFNFFGTGPCRSSSHGQWVLFPLPRRFQRRRAAVSSLYS